VVLQREFLLGRFVPRANKGNHTSARNGAERWRSLTDCFAVLSFHQKAVASVEYDRQADTCAIRSFARYVLRITTATMESVFPHISTRSSLYLSLLGEVLAVPSQISFEIESDTGRIRRIEERMNFVVAMAKLLANGHELELVLSKAKLTVDGVTCRNEVVSTAFERARLGPRDGSPTPTQKKNTAAESKNRTVRIADLLN
jgi:hypothetical protein